MAITPPGPRIRTLLVIVIALCLLNFAVFVAWSLFYHGSASAGKIENGWFFVGDHGHFTQVTKAAYYGSLYHGYSLWITHPLAMLSMAGLFAWQPPKKKK